jgi:hypothetical protein
MGASKAMATAVFGRVSQFFRWSILSPWHNKGHNRTVAYQRPFRRSAFPAFGIILGGPRLTYDPAHYFLFRGARKNIGADLDITPGWLL